MQEKGRNSFQNPKKPDQFSSMNSDQHFQDITAKYNQLNSNSIRTAKFNGNLEGSTKSIIDSAQLMSRKQCQPYNMDSIIYHHNSIGTGAAFLSNTTNDPIAEVYVNVNEDSNEIQSPSIEEYATAKCFDIDDCINLVGTNSGSTYSD